MNQTNDPQAILQEGRQIEVASETRSAISKHPSRKGSAKKKKRTRKQKRQAAERMRAYRQTPENTAYRREYARRPEVRARRQSQSRTSKYKARRNAQLALPEVKARMLAKRSTPEAKAKTSEWHRIHNARPEIKTRRQQRYQQIRQDPIRHAKALACAERYRKSEAGKVRQNERQRQRRQNDIQYAIKLRLRARLGIALRWAGTVKAFSTMDLLGCEIDFLIARIESLLKPGMTWQNVGRKKGGWEMDHIRPCISFDLTDPAQQRACFHYLNLQPLWWHENNKKADKWTPPEKISENKA